MPISPEIPVSDQWRFEVLRISYTSEDFRIACKVLMASHTELDRDFPPISSRWWDTGQGQRSGRVSRAYGRYGCFILKADRNALSIVACGPLVLCSASGYSTNQLEIDLRPKSLQEDHIGIVRDMGK